MEDNKLQQDPISRLYNNIKNDYDLPDFNTFKADMSDSTKASKLHNALLKDGYEMPSFDVFSVDMGLKKKAENLQSSGIPFQSPKKPDDFLQQGKKMASGEIFTDISKSVPKSAAQPVVKTTLKEAALKDKENNNSYLGAQWNNVVSSAERLAGGAAWLAQKFDSSPVSRIQEAVDKAASSVTGMNYEAQREKETTDKIKNFIGKARSNSSSREYEQGLAKGFDVTDGIGLDDIKSLGAILPSMLVDIGAGAATGGSSFAIQGYDDALSTIDSIPEAKYMSETTRTAFGFGGAIISGVLEKLGMDNILKSGTVTKYVTSKILKETAGELAKKGVKVTAEQFEKAVANKATQMLTKTALKNTVKAGGKSALVEGATEATQEGAMDLMKLAANQLEGSEIFDEEELKNTAASRYLNSAAMGGIFGGGLGSISSRTKNVQQHIEDEVKNAKTQEDIASIIDDINENLKDGTISENDAEVFKSMVDKDISKPSTLEIENEKETKLSDIDEFINSLDRNDRLYNDKLNELNKEKDEIISYYDDLSKKSQKDEETSFDDGKVTPTEEVVTEEVTPTEVKIEELGQKQVPEGKGNWRDEFNKETDPFRKSSILRAIADISNSEKELADILEAAKSMPEESNIINSAELGLKRIKEKKPIDIKQEVKPTEIKSVEQLREQEQAELDSKIPNAEQYRVDGKVDRTKLTNEKDINAFDEVYNKYDKLISPLLEKPTAVKVTKDIESEKANIEGERQAELANLKRGIPAMITKKLESDLKQYGFTDAQINKMTPIVANETLINAKYDAKLSSLESGKAEVKPTKAKEAVEEPKPVKEAPKEVKAEQAYKDLTRNEKRQIINSKFDELIKELKIEKICPT